MLTKLYADYTYPLLLEYSPLALVLPLARLAREVFRRRDRERVRRLTALIVLAAFSAASIWYFPDLIHVGFIAGMFWVAAAVSLEWILGAVRPPALSRFAGVMVMAGAGCVLIVHLVRYDRVLERQFPISHRTAFGVVDFTARWEPVHG